MFSGPPTVRGPSPCEVLTDYCPGLPTNAPDYEIRDGDEEEFVESLAGWLTLRGRDPSAELIVMVEREQFWECMAELWVRRAA